MTRNTSKYTNHTKEEIENYLKKVKKNIKADNFNICTSKKNRKNRDFLEKYHLDNNRVKNMLIELEIIDFCYSADNYNNPLERLYFFCREYELDNWGTLVTIEIYIKIAVKKDGYTVIISFHEPNKKIKRLFL